MSRGNPKNASARPAETDRADVTACDGGGENHSVADERARLAAALRAEAADYRSIYNDPYDDFEAGFIAGLEHAADLLDGDR